MPSLFLTCSAGVCLGPLAQDPGWLGVGGRNLVASAQDSAKWLFSRECGRRPRAPTAPPQKGDLPCVLGRKLATHRGTQPAPLWAEQGRWVQESAQCPPVIGMQDLGGRKGALGQALGEGAGHAHPGALPALLTLTLRLPVGSSLPLSPAHV